MKKNFLFILFIFCILIQPLYAAAPILNGESAILIVADTGEILFEKNSHARMYPASTTKILTAIIIIEDLKLDDQVVGDKEAAFTGGSRIYVMEDELFTVEELLYALLLESANDAAVALAKKHSGSVEAFVDVMNERAIEMGATESQFKNPNGLPDESHYTTTSDMAKIAAYAMKNEIFRSFVKTAEHDISPTNKQIETRHLYSSNRFLFGVGSGNKMTYNDKLIDIKYDIIDGVKTGYTIAAQNCFVGSAVKDGQRLISVVFKSQGREIYVDTRKLIDYGYTAFTQYKILNAGDVVTNIKIKGAAENKGLNLIAEKDVYKFMKNGEQSIPVETKIQLLEPIPLPIVKDQTLGKVVFLLGEDEVGSTPLIAEHGVNSEDMLTSLNSAITEEVRKAAQLDWWITLGLKLVVVFIVWRTLAVLLRPKRKRKQKTSTKQSTPVPEPLKTENVREFRNKRR